MEKVSFKENIKNYYNKEAELRDHKSIKVDWKIKVREEFLQISKAGT